MINPKPEAKPVATANEDDKNEEESAEDEEEEGDEDEPPRKRVRRGRAILADSDDSDDDDDNDDDDKPLVKGSSDSKAVRVADSEEIPDSWIRPVVAQTRAGRAVKRPTRRTR